MATPIPSYAVVSVPAGFASQAPQPGFPGPVLAAITEAHGRLMESLIGRPTTVVYVDFGIGDVTLFVETTLALPDSGQVWVGQYLVTYTSKTAGSLEGCTSRSRSRILGAGTVVTLYLPSVPPA